MGTSVVLNEFYASDLDTYQSGRVVYPLSDLEEGPHTLELKAWDVHNNSAKATLDFVVVSDLEVFLDGLSTTRIPWIGGARPSASTTIRPAWHWKCPIPGIRFDGKCRLAG